jgi:putative acetyltransferase
MPTNSPRRVSFLTATTGILMNKFDIHESQETELGAIQSLYAKAFPDEDLLPLVRDLLQNSAIVTSMVAVADSQIVGHLIFTRSGLVGDSVDISLLGPIGVVPT